jgi:hypothetical protein
LVVVVFFFFFFEEAVEKSPSRRHRLLFPISRPPFETETYLELKTVAAAAAAARRRAALRGTSTAAIAGVTALATEEGLASGIIIIFLASSEEEKFLFLSSLARRGRRLPFFFFFSRPFPFSFRFEIRIGEGKKETNPPKLSFIFVLVVSMVRDREETKRNEERKERGPLRLLCPPGGRAAVFSFSLLTFPPSLSLDPLPLSLSLPPQVQVLVRVPAAEKQQKQKQKQKQQGIVHKKPHFELLEGCQPQTTVADLKRQVPEFFFHLLLGLSSPSSASSSISSFSSPSSSILHGERERKRDRPSLTFAPLSLFSISFKQIAAKGYTSGSFDLPPRSQRLELAGRALADDAATLGTLGLAEAFVEQVAGFVVFDTEDEEEGKAAGKGT